VQVLRLTLTDVELERWLVGLRQDAAVASMAAALATGDQHTIERLSSVADLKRRRAEWLSAKVQTDDPHRTG
jgi:hypothetical protein